MLSLRAQIPAPEVIYNRYNGGAISPTTRLSLDGCVQGLADLHGDLGIAHHGNVAAKRGGRQGSLSIGGLTLCSPRLDGILSSRAFDTRWSCGKVGPQDLSNYWQGTRGQAGLSMRLKP